jgi:hypothetical protein
MVRQRPVGFRSAAVLGVITFGVGSKPLHALRTIRRIAELGEAGKYAERIVESAQTLRRHALTMSDHAIERMSTRLIDNTEVKDAIDRGSRFWDRQRRNLVAFEVDVPPGSKRVAAAIDIDSKKITTVYTESRTDEELSKVLIDNTPRYIKVPQLE